jgi:hypothetical protein
MHVKEKEKNSFQEKKDCFVLFSKAASIFLRSTLALMSSFNSSGGGFLGGIYLSDYK